MCTREAGAIYDAGGLTCILSFIRDYGFKIHKDTLHSAMSVVARLCAKMEPNDPTLENCVDSLSILLQAEDTYVSKRNFILVSIHTKYSFQHEIVIEDPFINRYSFICAIHSV